MGRGDAKTEKGKIFRHSYGNARPKPDRKKYNPKGGLERVISNTNQGGGIFGDNNRYNKAVDGLLRQAQEGCREIIGKYNSDSNLLTALKPVFTDVTIERMTIGCMGGQITQYQAQNWIYERDYLVLSHDGNLATDGQEILTLKGIKLSAIKGLNPKLKDEAIKITRDCFFSALNKLANSYSDFTYARADKVLKNAGECLRALYYLGYKYIPAKAKTTTRFSEHRKTRSGREYLILRGKYEPINLSVADIRMIKPSKAIFVQFNQLAPYENISDANFKPLAYVVKLI